MRYIPKLIPEDFRVLPEYFKGSPYQSQTKSKPLLALYWIIGIFFLLSALTFIKHPFLTLLLGLIGFLFLPPGQKWLEQKLRFTLTPKIKSIFCTLLFVFSIPLVGHYQEVDAQEAHESQVRKETEERQRIANEKKEQQRKDSVTYYLQAAEKFQKTSNVDKALSMLSFASNFSPNESELAEISKVKTVALSQRTLTLVKNGDYKKALPELSNFLSLDPSNSELLYNRAICYSKTGQMQEAVNDLKVAIEQGSSKAEKLHDKINPLRKRVIYYITRCWDGSPSGAKGRGACSHHGGVKDWNEPVYEEYRKY